MAKKNTEELMTELTEEKNIHDYLADNTGELREITLVAFLQKLLKEKKLKKADVGRKSGLGDYVHHIFDGSKNPKRIKVIALAFGFNATLEETQYMLRYAKQSPLYPRDRWDAIIISAINQGLSVVDTDNLLYNLGEKVFINE